MQRTKSSLISTILLTLLLGGCGADTPEAVEVSELPTLAATIPLPLPPTNVPPTLAATNTPVPTPSATPTVTNTPLPTDTPVVSFAPTDIPTPTRFFGLLPTKTPIVEVATPEPTVSSDMGYLGEIGPREFKVYIFEALEDQTIFAAVRVKPELDIGLQVFEGNITGEARAQGTSVQNYLKSNAPNRAADFNGKGLMEVIAYTPREDGEISIVVTSTADSSGTFRFYAFNQTTSSANIVYNQTVQLDSGQTTQVGATSNGGKPVVTFINPLSSGADARIVIKNSGGTVLTDANYAGGGSYETAYMLPPRTTSYSIELSNVGGSTESFEILIVALQEPF